MEYMETMSKPWRVATLYILYPGMVIEARFPHFCDKIAAEVDFC